MFSGYMHSNQSMKLLKKCNLWLNVFICSAHQNSSLPSGLNFTPIGNSMDLTNSYLYWFIRIVRLNTPNSKEWLNIIFTEDPIGYLIFMHMLNALGFVFHIHHYVHCIEFQFKLTEKTLDSRRCWHRSEQGSSILNCKFWINFFTY